MTNKSSYTMPALIGICGDKDTGKDTLAKELVPLGYVIVRMSTPLKMAAAHIFGLDIALSDDNKYKDTPLPEDHVFPFITAADFLNRVLEASAWVYDMPSVLAMTGPALVTPTGIPACIAALRIAANAEQRLAPLVFDEHWQPSRRPTPRLLQQIIGTEVFRAVDPDIWVWRWAQAAAQYEHVVTPDLRFPNEYEVMKSKGATLVRMHRQSVVRDTGHSSEGSLDNMPVDYEINNDGTIDQLRVSALRNLIKTDDLSLPASQSLQLSL